MKLRSGKQVIEQSHPGSTSSTLVHLPSDLKTGKIPNGAETVTEDFNKQDVTVGKQNNSSLITEEELLTEIDKLLNGKTTSEDASFTPATADILNNADGLKIKKEATTAYWEETNVSIEVEEVSNLKVAADPMEIVVEDVLDDSDNEVVEIPMSEVSHHQTMAKDTTPSTTSKRRLQSDGIKRQHSKKFFTDVKDFETKFYTNSNDASDFLDYHPTHSKEKRNRELDPMNVTNHTAQRSKGVTQVSVLDELPNEESPSKHNSLLLSSRDDNYTTSSVDENGTDQKLQNLKSRAGTSAKKVTFPYESIASKTQDIQPKLTSNREFDSNNVTDYTLQTFDGAKYVSVDRLPADESLSKNNPLSWSSSDDTDTTSLVDNTGTGQNILGLNSRTCTSTKKVTFPSESVSAKPQAIQPNATSTEDTYFTGSGTITPPRTRTEAFPNKTYKKIVGRVHNNCE